MWEKFYIDFGKLEFSAVKIAVHRQFCEVLKILKPRSRADFRG